MRCARDDLDGALAELSEVDGRDLADFLEQRGHHQLVVREGPPVILTVFLCSLPVRHGHTKKFPPRAHFYINERSPQGFPRIARQDTWVARQDTWVPNYNLNSFNRSRRRC